jgi:hydroxyethylthiazole kinase-like uncharacterized protein yjeF
LIRNYEAVNSETARLIDLNAGYLGVSDRQLMENAGRAVAEEIAHRFPVGSKVVVYAGTGRNGGDGLVAARHLACRGFKVKVLLIGSGDRIRDELTWLNYQAVRNMRFTVELEEVRDSKELKPVKADVIVDGLLGTGVKGVLREPMLTAVRTLNESEGFKVSVDVPSGVDSDTGEVLGEAVQADLTLTFHRLKVGLRNASALCGELKVVDIGIPPEAEFTAGPGDLTLMVKARDPMAHKGDFGRLLIIGGSDVYTGAPALAALAALRVGVDLAYVAAPEETAKTISSFSPDLITIKMEGRYLTPRNLNQLKAFLEKASAVAVGSGLGDREETFEFAKEVIELAWERVKPMVVDADAIAAFRDSGLNSHGKVVVTPHAGEFQKLTGKLPSENLLKRVDDVKDAAARFGSVILLKGSVDVVSDGLRVKLNYTGNPGMTVGGTGDVLTGVVGGFLAQGHPAFESAVAGAYVNGLAGDLAYRERGYQLTASDLLDRFPAIMMNPAEAHKAVKAS